MDHLLLFSYIFMITTSGAGIVASVLLYLRTKTRVTRLTALAIACLVVSLFVGMVGFYLQEILLFDWRDIRALTLPNTVLAIGIYSSIARLSLYVVPKLRIWVIGSTALVLFVQISRGILTFSDNHSILAGLHIPIIAFVSAWLLFMGILLSKSEPRETTDSFLLRRIGHLLIVFAPVSTMLYALIDLIPLEVRPLVSFDYLASLGLTAIVVIAFVRHLTRPSTVIHGGEIPAGFLRAHNITEREADVVKCVAEGCTNQEAADRLFVSLTTVRTHLYHVFQKTGAKNRVDLLRRIGGFTE